MIKYYLLITFLTVCESNINIAINASNFLNYTFIKYEGSDIKQVTDKEVQLFNITNENLNKGVRVEMGKVPDEVFLKDPTVYGNVFKKYRWPDVQRKLSVKNITVVEFIKKNVVVKSNVLINNTTMNIKWKTDMVEEVTNSATAAWNERGLPDDAINYEVSLDFEYGKVIHKAAWRDGNTSTYDMILTKSTGSMDIQPGQNVLIKLLAEKIILLLKVEMNALLVGNIVANYARVYGKYHLWSPTIGNIMKAGKLKNEVKTTFLLEVRYYANPRLEVIDKDTRKVIDIEEKKFKRKRKLKFYKPPPPPSTTTTTTLPPNCTTTKRPPKR